MDAGMAKTGQVCIKERGDHLQEVVSVCFTWINGYAPLITQGIVSCAAYLMPKPSTKSPRIHE